MGKEDEFTKPDKKCFPDVKDWDEFDYLFDLIVIEKRNPYLQGYHPREEAYPLLKMIAKSNIQEQTLRNWLIQTLEEGDINFEEIKTTGQ